MQFSARALDKIAADIRTLDAYLAVQDGMAAHWARESARLAFEADQARADGLHARAADLDREADVANRRADGYLTNSLLARVE